MTEYTIDHYAIRSWSSRSLPQQASLGMAVTAIYLFDDADEHRGTISFYSDTLPELKKPRLIHAQPLARDREGCIELCFYQVQFFPTLEQLRNGEATHIYFKDSENAGLR